MQYRFPALVACAVLLSLVPFPVTAAANEDGWNKRLDGQIRFYQTTEIGALLVGTEKSLYALEATSGDVLWRRKNLRLDETDVAPVTGTDLALLGYESDNRTRFEAVDLLSGKALWRSDRVRGAAMQMAIDPDSSLIAVVVVRDARAKANSGFKRKPTVYVFNLRDGDELWKQELGDVEMMPARWPEQDGEDVSYTLDNYHPPLFIDGRLYLFYDGVYSVDARTGKERTRERFRVNEEGLALTEADAVVGNQFLYFSGRGRVRAVSRASSRVEWEAKDLGLTPEVILVDDVLYVRTGGQFTRLRDGETVERGPYGVSAIDARTGKTLWRYRGADKGITNIALIDEGTLLVADRDDLFSLDARTGKRLSKSSHGVERAAFVLVNERGHAVVGGASEIAAFDSTVSKLVWRARHKAPGRGLFRSILSVALRAASLYFRYGGPVSAAFRGVRIAQAVTGLRWSGIARGIGPSLTSLATNAARERITARFKPLGIAARINDLKNRRAFTQLDYGPDEADIAERLIDRLDPASQADRLSRFLWHRREVSQLRGRWIYFYTGLKRRGGNGLAGVNVNTGETEREIRLSEPDLRFVTDEVAGLLYAAKGDRLFAH
ncbi:MAG TPA: PQQ-binding-like beta-propeller repeat protein, partial [Blastocatellia bacterium]